MKKKVLITILFMLFLSNCSSTLYIAKQSFYQLKLIYESQPIELALRRADLPNNTRDKLKLVLDIRHFAKNNLYLKVNKNYKDVDLDYNIVVHTVSACEPLAFKPYEWWFPILGSVPYKGFFDKKDADKEEMRLKSLGYETQNRAIQGYSTLGFFADPIWPNMLLLSDFALIELIIHELTHATIYFPNHTIFNESLANFIGLIGTELYLKDRFAHNSETVNNYINYQKNISIYRDFFHNIYQELDSIYNSSKTKQEKEDNKKNIFITAAKNYNKLSISNEFKNIDWSKINNATILSFKRYNYDETIFFDLLAILHNNLSLFFEEIAVIKDSKNPFLDLKNRISQLKGLS